MKNFDKPTVVAATLKLAREQFEAFAAMDAPEVPEDETNAMQLRLCRWQRDRFGLQVETHDLRMALGIIEEMGETFDAETAELALDGLGDTCVYAGQILLANRLAIAPVLDLARVFAAAGGELVPATGPSKLAHTVLKGSQKIRGLADSNVFRERLVEHVAMCIAKVIDDVEVGHGIAVRAAEVYKIVGAEVMLRRQGDVMIPGATEIVEAIKHDEATREQALKDLVRANEALGVAEVVEGPGDFVVEARKP